ncbi:MAG: DUF3352 domain-containing protein [Scytolyngbya sp. HA4215-MV1]|nr:DUF3352 domain-containing protein [Scytolyngbya sp. HA4215-MV1]
MPGKKSLLIPAIAATVVIAGGAATYLYLKGSGSSGEAFSPMASAKIVPDDAIMTSFISTDDATWSKLQKFGTPEAQKYFGASLKEFQQKLLTESQVDFEKDVKPWVGSVMIAALPSGAAKPVQQTTPDKPVPPNLLLVVGIKDKVSALKFANKMKSQAGVKSTESDYKGVKIAEFTGKGSPTYSAVIQDYLVLAPQRQWVEQAIETSKGQPSFASKAGASSLFAADAIDLKNPLARIYLPDYASAIQQLAANNPKGSPISPQGLSQLKQVQSVVAGIGVDDQGLRFKAVANIDPKTAKIEYKPAPGKIVSQFPAETMALLSGAGINHYWQQISEQSKSDENTAATFNQVRQQLKAAADIDLDKELFGWMDGEFAIGAISSNQGLLAPIGFGGVMVFDTSDRKTAEATLTKIDNFAKRNSVKVAERDIQGKKVTEWQVPQGVLLGHGWLDQDSVFVAMGQPLVDAISTKPTQPLDGSPTFKNATASLPQPNMGYFYIDMEKVMVLVNRNLAAQPNTIPPQTAAMLNSIQGIGASAFWPNKTTNHLEVVLALKSAK